jgi:hypothetical protein
MRAGAAILIAAALLLLSGCGEFDSTTGSPSPAPDTFRTRHSGPDQDLQQQLDVRLFRAVQWPWANTNPAISAAASSCIAGIAP